MSVAPKRPCARCGRLVVGRCTRCARAQDLARGSASARGYDRTWHTYARAWLQRFPICGQRADGRLHAEHSACVRAGDHTRARVVDHIVPLAAAGARLEPSNHQSLCTACNAVKARTADVVAVRQHAHDHTRAGRSTPMPLIALVVATKRTGQCRAPSCRAALDWYRTVAGKAMPMNRGAVATTTTDGVGEFDAADSHWSTCAARAQFVRRAPATGG
jgi:5-methylcytosine-specific restriction endonuclease McrA